MIVYCACLAAALARTKNNIYIYIYARPFIAGAIIYSTILQCIRVLFIVLMHCVFVDEYSHQFITF